MLPQQYKQTSDTTVTMGVPCDTTAFCTGAIADSTSTAVALVEDDDDWLDTTATATNAALSTSTAPITPLHKPRSKHLPLRIGGFYLSRNAFRGVRYVLLVLEDKSQSGGSDAKVTIMRPNTGKQRISVQVNMYTK